MNIVIVGSRAAESLENHLLDSFRALGHNARLVDVTMVLPVSNQVSYWMARFAGPYDRLLARRLADRVRTYRPDLVLVVYRHLHPLLVDCIKSDLPGVIVAQINPDALTNLEKQQTIAADFDFYFSKEPYITSFLRDKAGLNAYYLPEGFNPRVHKRPSLEKEAAERMVNVDVLVYGGLYAYRARLVEQLLSAGVNVAVYGTEGPYLRPRVRSVFRGRYLVGDDKNRLVYGAKIVLNGFHYAEVSSANQKYFEINGIGGFQLCDYKPTIDEYTVVPADRVTFGTMEDAIQKIRYYLAHPAERYELAEQQYTHFQQHHTFDHRVKELFTVIQLPIDHEQAVG